MKRMQIVAIVLCAMAAVIIFGVWASGRLDPSSTSHKLQVTASFYPVAEFTRHVGGDNVSVTTLVKPGVEPHDYDPSPREVASIYTSKLLVYNGAGLEKWVGRLQGDLSKKGVAVVEASQGIDYKTASGGDNSPLDPHVWMDPQLAVQEVKNIRDALDMIDPIHRHTYDTNAAQYIESLLSLDSSFRTGLAHCQSQDIVTSHQAFQYLAAEYGLRAVSISGLSPESEPSPQKLAEVANFVKQHNVRYIFFETLVSPKLAETIAHETGAQTIVFNPLEGLTRQEMDDGKTYISVQNDNLQALKTALHCQ